MQLRQVVVVVMKVASQTQVSKVVGMAATAGQVCMSFNGQYWLCYNTLRLPSELSEQPSSPPLQLPKPKRVPPSKHRLTL